MGTVSHGDRHFCYIARKMAVGANRNYLPTFNIILGVGNKF